jgi:hypothetical protein
MTSEEMNKFLADGRRRHQEKYKRLEADYQAALNGESTTPEARRRFEAEVEELQRHFRTEETPPATEERDWHKMYEDAVKKRRAELDAEEDVK